jgi:S-formylglutathione hydrolase FrmB
MGGYGVVRLGLKFPEVFSSIYSLSPCCLAANMNPQPETGSQAEAIKTLQEVEKANLGVRTMLASAAAWSPNPKNPPFFIDLPTKDGQVQPEVTAEWAANAPLAMIHQYVPNLKKYKAIAIDAGNNDKRIADTVRTLDKILTDYGIRHEFEIYEGDHVNQVATRLETKVLPFFAANLSFMAKKK